MATHDFFKAFLAVGPMAILAACGGGGGIASAPTPVAAPAPTNPQAGPVDILNSPSTQEFVAFSKGDALRIRFDAESSKYEVMAPGRNWDTLIDEPQSDPGLALFASAPELNQSYFSYRTRHDHPDSVFRYQYSSFASWRLGPTSQGQALEGIVAFSSPTPTGGVPTAGTASYSGLIRGDADVPALSGWGDHASAPIEGDVTLNFDFASSTLGGQIRPTLGCDCDPISFPTLTFTDARFSSGSQTFSGRFATNVSGDNSFSGRFTGPQAQELIGQWAFPFLFEETEHSATGIWIAKRD